MKIAVIGLGAIGPSHVDGIKRCGQEIVALCDIVKERCEKANKDYSLKAEIYTDYKKMLDEEKLDAVHICTPHYLHAEMVVECLKHNINVLCEKPLAISYGQLDEIEKAVVSSTAQLGVCQQNRYNYATRKAKEYFKGEEIISAVGTLTWNRDRNYYLSGEWRGKKGTEGGGVVINQALHTLDLLQYFCKMPNSCIGHTFNDRLKDVIEVEESAFATYDFSGGRFVFQATNSSSVSFPVTISLTSKTKQATIVGNGIIINDEFHTQSEDLKFGKTEWGTGHAPLIKDFYDCLQSGRKFPIDFYEGQKAVKLILALYKSDGKEIEIK